MASAQLASWQMHVEGPSALGGPTNNSLNGTGIGLAWVVQAQTVSAITGIRFRYGSRTGTPPSYVLTVEGLDASGNPNGTDKGGGSPTAKIFTPPASTAWNGLVQQVNFTNSYTPATKGEWLAFTIRHSSGTCDASNFSSFTRVFNGVYGTTHLQTPQTLSGGAWTLISNGSNVAWLTASETIGVCVESEKDTLTASTIGHRQGQYFTIPSTFGTSIKVRGVHMVCRSQANKSLKVVILDTSNNVQATQTIENEHMQASATHRPMLVYFDSPPTLTCGTKYRVCLEVTESIAAAVAIQGLTFASTGDKTAMPLGANIGFAEWNGTTWTETDTIYPLCDLILDDITVPSGGGGAGACVIGG